MRHPLAYGAGWLATEFWCQLGLGAFWKEKLGWTREGTEWARTRLVSVAYRLIAPGSEWQCWCKRPVQRRGGSLAGGAFGPGLLTRGLPPGGQERV